MVGIMPQAGMQAPQGQADDRVQDDEGGNATPEEQAQYEQFVLHGFELLYSGGKVKPEILKMLDDDPSDLMAVLERADAQQFSPVVALAATAAIVTLQVVKEYQQEDGNIPDGTIILHGGQALLEELAEIAQKKGSYDYSEDEMAEAFRMAADLYREAGKDAGVVDEEEAKHEFGEIVQADREGRAGDLLPGIDKLGQQSAEQPEQGAGQ